MKYVQYFSFLAYILSIILECCAVHANHCYGYKFTQPIIMCIPMLPPTCSLLGPTFSESHLYTIKKVSIAGQCPPYPLSGWCMGELVGGCARYYQSGDTHQAIESVMGYHVFTKDLLIRWEEYINTWFCFISNSMNDVMFCAKSWQMTIWSKLCPRTN